MAAKLIKKEIWGLFHWKAECLLMKIGSFAASSDLHYGPEVSPFEVERDFLLAFLANLVQIFRQIMENLKLVPMGSYG